MKKYSKNGIIFFSGMLFTVFLFFSGLFLGALSDTHAQNPPVKPPVTEAPPVLSPDSVIAIQKLQIAILAKQNQAKDLALQYSQVQVESQTLQSQLAAAVDQALKDANADPAKWQVDAQQVKIIPRPQPPAPAKK